MPTQCVPERRCGADFSGWLKGGHPTLANGEVSSEVCFNRRGDCCKESKNIKVKDCGPTLYTNYKSHLDVPRATAAQTECYEQVILHSERIHKSIYWHAHVHQ